MSAAVSRSLKLIVIAMGVLLVAGSIALLALVAKKISKENLSSPSLCQNAMLDVTGQGRVVDSEIEGNLLRLTLQKAPGHTEILTVDPCSGKLLGRLTLRTD